VSAVHGTNRPDSGVATTFLEGEPPYRFRVSLRIWHPTKDPDEYTQSLGLSPHVSASAGEMVYRNGVARGIAKESYWSHEFEPSDVPEDVDQLMERVVDRLASHASLIHEVGATGGQAELFIGVFLKQLNVVFMLSPTLQRKCADLGLRLAFDVYGDDTSMSSTPTN